VEPVVTVAQTANQAELDKARDYGVTGQIDAGFIRRTYRSTLVLATFGLLYLAAYGYTRLVWPAALGIGVGLGLLYGAEVMVQNWLSADAAPARRNKKPSAERMSPRTKLIVLIKYTSAIFLLWYISRFWDMPSIAAFAGGVCLVQVSIVSRAISRVILAGWGNAK